MYRSYTPTCYYVLFYYFLHHVIRLYVFYGPMVPEINYYYYYYIINTPKENITTFEEKYGFGKDKTVMNNLTVGLNSIMMRTTKSIYVI